MRKTVLAATAAIGVAGLAPRAHAQLAVIDGANLAQTTQAAATALQELSQLRAQLTTLQNTYGMLTNPSNITGMLPGLNSSYLQNPMPASNTMASQIIGSGGMNGVAQTFYGMNQAPIGSDPNGAWLTQSSVSMANIQGMAAGNLDSIQDRLSELDQMQQTLEDAPDIKQVDAVNGRLAIESNAIQAQTAQATNLQTLAVTQVQEQQLQQQQVARSDAEAMQSAFPSEVQ